MLHDILERHRDDLAFLWLQRDFAVHAPHFDLRLLADLDERIDAHLDGLRVAGGAGLASLHAALDPEEPGIAFAAAVLAIEAGGGAALAPVLELAANEASIARALISAFGWAPPDRAAAAAESLLEAGAPPLHWAIGIAAHTVHRLDPEGLLANALLDPDPLLRARALRAAGELGRVDLVPEIGRALGDADEDCRFWAAWSGALLNAAPAVPVIWSFAESAGPRALRAMKIAARVLDPREALPRLEALAARPEHARVAVVGAGALGDPGAVPWLLARMEDAPMARLAGESFTMITGIAVEHERAASAPAGFRAGPSDDPAADDVAMDPDRDRPWPAASALAAVFRARGGDLRRGARYLLGQAITEASTLRVLRAGRQPERAAAAIERSLLAPGRALFEVRAPAFRQKLVAA
ncbi:HEAT repeat protein [Minicystis rosea]|nr:HEAT repeat protein [Minicystis rosea]